MRRLTAVLMSAAIGTLMTAGATYGYTSGSDVVLFFDHCDRRLNAINPDGTGRRALLDVGNVWPLDVTRDPGPVTVLSPGHRNPSDPSSGRTLYAIDPSGAQAPVDLLPPGAPYQGGLGVFSPGGDRIAYVHGPIDPTTGTTKTIELYIGDVVRDSGSGAVAALTNITLVADLWQIGQPTDSDARGPITGALDLSRDGRSIAVVIYDDLWRLDLAADGHTLVSATPLTRTKRFAELDPRWSPVADVVAFSGGPLSDDPGFTALMLRDINLYTLEVASGAVRQVTTNKNRGGSGTHRHHPAWSPDGRFLLYSAAGQSASGKRNLPCSGTNYDLFRIPADGSSKAIAVTATADRIEDDPSWGWR